ncbi:NUDIX hydrolase [Asticcacaulis endophyticus]|uniref:Nudix hydrolase domain-containing protein n=1 Tax=Asticcacaulis endophyticus TaxID=1395890 RepID=A0A918Q4P4_9CAUL|nr:NUDIX hydrolase [Asticcacaulis endophyticus]GGZ31010.1 hypothetical protein GCM10011273_16900 [Asticcacaulis endophyticus]
MTENLGPYKNADQYAALPYRKTIFGGLQILLITSRGSRQWIIPKGKPIPGLSPPEAAAREAYEEAGIIGDISDTPVGNFAYVKDRGLPGQCLIPCVEVFPMNVTQQLTLWPEMGQRQVLWFDAEYAAGLVEIPVLRDIILRFAADDSATRSPT